MSAIKPPTELVASALTAAAVAVATGHPAAGQSLPPPTFHHLHLNAVAPDAAIDFYTREFPSTSRATWGGFPALRSPNNVMVLFTKVETTPPILPQTAIWHF